VLLFTAAIDYLKHNPLEPIEYEKLESECGVGIVITPDQVEAAVEDVIAKHKAGLTEQRYRYNVGLIMGMLDCSTCLFSDNDSLWILLWILLSRSSDHFNIESSLVVCLTGDW